MVRFVGILDCEGAESAVALLRRSLHREVIARSDLVPLTSRADPHRAFSPGPGGPIGERSPGWHPRIALPLPRTGQRKRAANAPPSSATVSASGWGDTDWQFPAWCVVRGDLNWPGKAITREVLMSEVVARAEDKECCQHRHQRGLPGRWTLGGHRPPFCANAADRNIRAAAQWNERRPRNGRLSVAPTATNAAGAEPAGGRREKARKARGRAGRQIAGEERMLRVIIGLVAAAPARSELEYHPRWTQ